MMLTVSLYNTRFLQLPGVWGKNLLPKIQQSSAGVKCARHANRLPDRLWRSIPDEVLDIR